MLTLTALVAVGLMLARGGSDDDAAGEADVPDGGSGPGSSPAELPGGGTRILPDRRVVAYYGAPQDRELGALGIGSPKEAAARLKRQAKPYETRKRPVLPAFELLATVAASDPGEDGEYILRQPPEVIERYLAAARRAKAILVLDIQPGRADFPGEVERLARWLREPDVSLALDPEWHVGPGEVPGQVIGSVDASVVNQVARRLQRTIERNDLPQKLLIVHQFTRDMIENRDTLRAPEDVALTLNVDGFGGVEIKEAKYRELRAKPRTGLFNGFKLFYSEDDGLMSPERVLKLKPEPDVVVYE
ncbi:hypothetical protein BH24ACT23_BH24ACT23_02420 [soil metagenome]